MKTTNNHRIISLYFTVFILLSLIFLTISTYVTQKITKNYAISFLILLYLIFFYRYQTSDIFVDLIILPLIFLGFLNFYEFIINEKESNENKELQFTVQIMVGEATISADELFSIGKLGDFDKNATGSEMYEYYAGTYSTLEEANIQLNKAKQEGFSNAFIFATQRGKRIPLNQAIELLKEE